MGSPITKAGPQSSNGPSFEFKAENNCVQLDTMYLNNMNRRKEMKAYPHEQRDKNELYKTDTFKTRIIELKEGENCPRMSLAKWNRM